MRALFSKAIDWFLNLHILAKIAWFMGIIVLLLFAIPWLFGGSLVRGNLDQRTERAAKTLQQLEQLDPNQGYKFDDSDSPKTTTGRREEYRDQGGDDGIKDLDNSDLNQEENNDSGSRRGRDTDL